MIKTLKQKELKEQPEELAKKPVTEDVPLAKEAPQEQDRVFNFKHSDLVTDMVGEGQSFANGDKVTITLSGTVVSTEEGISVKADEISAAKVEPEETLAKEPLTMTEALGKAKKGRMT